MLVYDDYDTDEAGDVFAQDATIHPAFQESFPVTPDVCEGLFGRFLTSELFEGWLHQDESWLLQVVGGPGSGKTTFAALAMQQVRNVCRNPPVLESRHAAIFIGDSYIENELAFLEDILASIYKQLTPVDSPIADATKRSYREYNKSQHTGRRASERIDLIARALRCRIEDLSKDGRAFLLVDQIEQCSPSLQELVQRELKTLQNRGLKIMITSRLPRYEAVVDRWCDYHPRDLPIQIFWRCCICERDICATCRGNQRYCLSCGPVGLWEPPEQYSLIIDSPRARSIYDYVVWDLEREHGDLGFSTLANPYEPPLSSFGLAFRATKHGAAGEDWVWKIVDYIDRSILQAKLFLDRIHSASSPDTVDLNPKRLPPNVQANFQIAISTIEQQSSDHNTLALKSIAAVGKEGDTIQGLPFGRLATLLKERPYRMEPRTLPARSPEDILQAANGYLTVIAPLFPGQDYTIATFHRLFWVFANDEYNEELVLAYSLLPTSKVPRSFTIQSPAPTSPPAVQLPQSFRRESSGLTRSLTFFPSGPPAASSSAGLGFRGFDLPNFSK